jgi:hypothetical protein
MDLVETKAPDGALSGAQERDHARRAARGIKVKVCHTIDQVNAYIESRRPYWL